MRRLLLLLPLLLLVTACDAGGPPASPMDQGVSASFPRGGIADVIKVEARDALPLRAAELVGPDGDATPASALQSARSPQVRDGQEAAGSPWRTSMFEDNIAALPNAPAVAAYRSYSQVLVFVSTADIPLPDPVTYRRDWTKYRIRLSFTGPGGQLQTREIAAPAPLPPPQ
ncbi:MAG TPA: hypothetical protein VET89_13450 [Stellaceae bacterium]|nr:hypothetical protein [Stellaceae bacterium]